MKTFQRLVVSGLLVTVLGLSGCIVARDRGTYTYEHGDRIDSYGHREVHWCDSHHDDEHCRP